MPGWQKFYEKYRNDDFEILSVSVDIQGADVVKPYAQDQSFKTVIDTENVFANLFDFKIVPNGILIDKSGRIKLIKQGFHESNDEHIEVLRKFIFEETDQLELDGMYVNTTHTPTNLEKQLVQTKFKLAMEYANQAKTDASLKELDEALLLDTDNFLIRKQRWYLRNPEKFSPTIDVEWQQQQLEKEKQAEAQDCGPDGCVIPGTDKKGALNDC